MIQRDCRTTDITFRLRSNNNKNTHTHVGNDMNKKNPTGLAAFNAVNNMAECIKCKGFKPFIDNFFSSPEMYSYLFSRNPQIGY